MTAYGYVRVSTRDQVEGFGIEVQRDTLRRWSTTLTSLYVFVDEGVSGKLTDRPALGDAIDRLEEGDVLVVPRLDRLARDLITQELLLRAIRAKGADVVSCVQGENAYLAEDAGDPSRKLIRQILGAVAEYERSMIALRTQAGRRAKKAAGGYAGGQPPYGWTGIGGELVPVAEEQDVLTSMRSMSSDGASNESTAVMLNTFGWRTRKGKMWTASSVRKTLARGTPAGAVGQDRVAVDSSEVDDQVAVLDGDGGQDVGADGSGPFGLG